MINQLSLKDHLKDQKYNLLPIATIFAGILFSLYLQSQTPDGSFFSGDAGLKFLLTKQLSNGEIQFNLDLNPESWVNSLWQGGFYPFHSPFVYEISNQHYITFPFTFPLVSAPFYAIFGFRGLYILPLISTWAIWIFTYLVCQRFAIGVGITTAILISLIFASPLTIYSAIFWEHNLAIALAFGGLTILLGKSLKDLSAIAVLFSGISIGLSVWFREELLCLVLALFLISAFTLYFNLKNKSSLNRKVIIFTASLLITVSLFFGANTLIYGHPLGAHSFQVVESLSLVHRLRSALENFRKLSADFFYYFPATILSFIYLGIACFNKRILLKKEAKILFLICFIFTLTLPFILPAAQGISLESRTGGKQWGPRFLLILIPLISTIVAIGLKELTKSTTPYLKYFTIAIFSTLLVFGLQLNSFAGRDFLANSQQVAPLLNYLKQHPDRIIASSHQYVNQSLAMLFDQKSFFLAETSKELEKLSTALYQTGHEKFLYVCYPYRKCEPALEMVGTTNINLEKDRYAIQFSNIGTFGKYPLYEVSVRAE
jgi:hypothetical protein